MANLSSKSSAPAGNKGKTGEYPDDSLYLRCLTDKLSDTNLINRLSDDYDAHREQDIYINYLEQVTTANNTKKGDKTMVCEGLFRLYGTSSKEIIERTKK